MVILEILSLNLRDIGLQRFQVFVDICQFLFRDMEYFSKYLKGYGILGNPNTHAPPPPLQGPHAVIAAAAVKINKMADGGDFLLIVSNDDCILL